MREMSIEKKSPTGLDRRTFMKNASMAALAGAGGVATVSSSVSAQESSTSIPKLAGGKYDSTLPITESVRIVLDGILLHYAIPKAPLSMAWVSHRWISSVRLV